MFLQNNLLVMHSPAIPRGQNRDKGTHAASTDFSSHHTTSQLAGNGFGLLSSGWLTWPFSVDQLPLDFENLSEEDVLFPFGFGLERPEDNTNSYAVVHDSDAIGYSE